MTDQLMGIDYFSLSTLMKDDDKVFDLKYRYAVPEGATGEAYDNDAAFAAYGRFVELLASIYREGFCLQMSKQTRLRLSQQLGLRSRRSTRSLKPASRSGCSIRRCGMPNACLPRTAYRPATSTPSSAARAACRPI